MQYYEPFPHFTAPSYAPVFTGGWFSGGLFGSDMPGIKQLDDRAFIQSFKAMDDIIQNNQPIFMLVWLGSVLALLATAGFGINRLSG